MEGRVKSCKRVSGIHVGFTTVDRRVSGVENRMVFGNCGREGEEVAPFQGVVRMDLKTGEEVRDGAQSDNGSIIPTPDYITKNPSTCRCAPHPLQDVWFPSSPSSFAGEPTFVARQGGPGTEGDGYLVSIVRNIDSTEMVILDAMKVAEGPVAVVTLGDEPLPHGYHGYWADDNADWGREEIRRRAKLADKLEAKGNLFNEVKVRRRDGEERSDEHKVVSYSAMQYTGGAKRRPIGSFLKRDRWHVVVAAFLPVIVLCNIRSFTPRLQLTDIPFALIISE